MGAAMSVAAARIPPGSKRDIGAIPAAIAAAAGRAIGSGPPNLFTTLARHRRLFLPWLWFAGMLMPRGRLPRKDTEIVILRVAHNCRCEYEWSHHERIAQTVGLAADDVQRVREGPVAHGFSERQSLLLRATDELHRRRDITSRTWDGLRRILSDVELIELCMLVGHYEMLAMTLNALRVQPDR
jgi:alkylhydroperoxidase family enzyme